MNDAVATSVPRLTGVVSLVDRLFPIGWIGVYLLLPVSGWADEMLGSWHDQMKFLAALRDVLDSGTSELVVNNTIGPGYIALAAWIHQITSLSPEDSLVLLNRGAYALSVTAGLVLVRVLVRRSAQAPPLVSLASQVLFAALMIAAGTWWWSDVPWTHFVAACLAVALYCVRFAPSRPSPAMASLAGVCAGLLATTRSFEFLAVVVAWCLMAGVLSLLRVAPARTWSVARLAAGVGGFFLVTIAAHLTTGKHDIFLLYSQALGRQAADLSGPEIAETPTFSISLIPVKLVQLFVDPCYLSLCATSDYATRGGRGTNLDLWSLPLGVQLPMLLLLPLCLIGVAVLMVRSLRRRGEVAELRPLAEMTVAASGLVVGYAASTLTGPSHLQYGFARDFLLPALLTAIVAVVLVSRAVWPALERRRGSSVSPEVVYVAAVVLVGVGIIAAAAVGRSSGFPRFEARHLEEVTYTARCTGRACAISLRARTPSGGEATIPAASVLTFGCGSDEARLSLYVRNLDARVRVSECADPRLVAAWPTVMGLPPGSQELAAVAVRNV